jgi:tight adherence protein B
VRTAIDRGDSEEKAIQAFGTHVAHPDIKLFTTALFLSRKEGASIGESLHRLSRVTRQRQSFRRKIKTALAMQKLSALGISLSAIALTLIQVGTNPAAVTTALSHPIGSKALLGGCFFMAMGLLWMARMARAKV